MATGGSVIGALRVVIGADSAALETGLKKASSSLANFGKQVTTIAAGIQLQRMFEDLARAIADSFAKAITEADKLGKMAQSIGIPVEELSRLKHAADLSGIGMEQLGVSVGKLSKNMVEAASNVKGDVARAFQALGISVKNADGTLKSSTQVMDEIATKFAGMEDGAGKTALAIALFGRSGAALIPMLNAGAKGLEEMRTEADKLGIVISDKTFRAAEAFNDNLKRMEAAKQGVVTQITARLLPALQSLSEAFVQGAKNAELMKATGDIIGNGMRGVGTIFAVLGFVILDVILKFGRLMETIKAFATLDWSKGIEIAKQSATDANSRFAALSETIKKLWSDMSKAPASLGIGPEKIAAPIIAAAAAAKNALESYLDSQKKSTAAQQAEVETFFLAAGAKEKLKVQLQALTVAQNANIVVSAAMKAQIDAVALAAGNMAMQLGALRVIEDTMPAWEKYNLEVAKLTELFNAGVLSSARYEQALRRTAEAAGTAWDIAGASIAGSISTIAGTFGKENKKMAAIAKAAGIVQGTISMFTGAAKALELPFPANLAAMAAVLATGAKLVASIKSQAIPSFAHGADFVMGGAGGVDNNLLMANISRGERVRVDPAGQTGDDSRPNIVQVTLNGIGASRAEMGRLFDSMNDMLRDGYTLKLNPA